MSATCVDTPRVSLSRRPEAVENEGFPHRDLATAREAHRFQCGVRALAASVRTIEPRRFEGRSLDTCTDSLLPQLWAVLDAGAALGSTLERSFEHAPQQFEDEESSLQEVGFLAARGAVQETTWEAASNIASTAFVVGLELQARRQRLERAAASGQVDALLDAAGSAIRRLLRSCQALEAALESLSGMPCESGTLDLEYSLEVRRAYTALRAEIDAATAPGPDRVWARLQRVGARIQALHNKAVYGRMRLGDRRQMEALEGRIRKGRIEGADTTSAMRLWQDLGGFGDLLAQINQRQELIAHDGAVAARSLARLTEARETGLAAPLLKVAAQLRGASPHINELLDRESCEWAAWHTALSEVANRCACVGPSQPASEVWGE